MYHSFFLLWKVDKNFFEGTLISRSEKLSSKIWLLYWTVAWNQLDSERVNREIAYLLRILGVNGQLPKSQSQKILISVLADQKSQLEHGFIQRSTSACIIKIFEQFGLQVGSSNRVHKTQIHSIQRWHHFGTKTCVSAFLLEKRFHPL
jgi:hypothetical protein